MAEQPLISVATAECPATAGCDAPNLHSGVVLAVTFNQPVAVAPSYSVLLADGSGEGTLTASNSTALAAGQTLNITVTSASVADDGRPLSLDGLEVMGANGITALEGGRPWNVLLSGTTGIDASGACVPVGSRTFGGTNCSISSSSPAPTPPQVFDVIAVPTVDLPGAPLDGAPEVITSCRPATMDTAVDVDSGEVLGASPCGSAPPGEGALRNSTSNTLDYIPTPSLRSFQRVGVVETLNGSNYLSGTALPPEIAAARIDGDRVTFTYGTDVRCPAPHSPNTVAQFQYAQPWWSTNQADVVYAASVQCSATMTRTISDVFDNPIPTNGVRFKYQGYGAGYYVTGTGAFASVRAASQSFYVDSDRSNPRASVKVLRAPVAVEGGPGSVTFELTFMAHNATQCSISTTPAAASRAFIEYDWSPAPPSFQMLAPCPAIVGRARVMLPGEMSGPAQRFQIQLRADGLPGTPSATDVINVMLCPQANPKSAGRFVPRCSASNRS